MKILLYSYTFLPTLGGIEVVSATIAEHLISMGHECSIITETSSEAGDNFVYKVFRKPSFFNRISLVWNHDIVHSNGASLALFFYAKLLRKPFVWTHGGYQLSCIDGLGWVDGEKAPLNPWQSFKFHWVRKGALFAIVGGLKLLIRRWAGSMVDRNIAVTNWVANRQPLPRQQVIYNPFPLENFSSIKSKDKVFDFIYVGRIVSEKGVPDLLKAFAIISRNKNYSLVIVGDGNWRQKMELLAFELGIQGAVTFTGKKTGIHLFNIVAISGIAIVPSVWEEPMGGVALEMLAAGKNVIVSCNGGLSECIGDAGLTFENGNFEMLANKMISLHSNLYIQTTQRKIAIEQLKHFNPQILMEQYISLYKMILNQK